ncbi:MAG TPA: hypothetical protein VKE69_05425, partial [Planctomycetota bacterium]|nr:hypothetical protein [Planctomycetota bacterium]
RLDRFLIPTQLGVWTLGAGWLVTMLARFDGRRLVVASAAAALALFATTGVGVAAGIRALHPGTPESAVAHYSRHWSWWPSAFCRTEADGPDPCQVVVDLAAAHLDPSRPFGWLGDLERGLPLAIVRYRFFQASGWIGALDFPMEDAQADWDEEAIRRWSFRFPQIATYEPPDPVAPSRAHERRFAEWMRRNPAFQLVAEAQVREGDKERRLSFFRRAGSAPGSAPSDGDGHGDR